MKKLILILVLIFATSTMFAQTEWNRWAISAEYGMHDVSDESAILLDDLSNHSLTDGHHYGLTVRYNFNPKFGLGIVGGFDNIALEDFNHNPVDLDYARLNLEMYLNFFQLLDLQNNVFTLIGHGGPGISLIDGEYHYIKKQPKYTEEGVGVNYSQSVGNFSGGLTGLFKITRWAAITLDWTSTGNWNQDRTIDGYMPVSNEGINSVVHNYSVGLTFYLGKKGKDGNKRQHADWIIPVDVVPVVNNYITNTSPIITETHTQVEIVKVAVYHQEYVFFDHDKYDFRDSELNAIFKAFTELNENPTYKLVIKAFASPTSSTEEYNLVLSQKRASVIIDKFLAMGIAPSRLSSESFGKDHDYDDEQSVYDAARRVELIMIRK